MNESLPSGASSVRVSSRTSCTTMAILHVAAWIIRTTRVCAAKTTAPKPTWHQYTTLTYSLS